MLAQYDFTQYTIVSIFVLLLWIFELSIKLLIYTLIAYIQLLYYTTNIEI